MWPPRFDNEPVLDEIFRLEVKGETETDTDEPVCYIVLFS